MTKKKSFLDEASGKTRKKTLEELKKKGIEIESDDQISGGFLETPRWGEDPLAGEPGKPGAEDKNL